MSEAFKKISYGLFVVTTKANQKYTGCIVNTVMQLTTSPNKISVAINKQNYTHDMVKQNGEFNVSIISEKADFSLFKHFGFQSGRTVDKFKDFEDYKIAKNGVPYVTKGTNAFISAKVIESVDLGTHTLFIASVSEDFDLEETPSATYEYYLANIKPKPEKPKKTAWQCKICGYTEEVEELPEDFICPWCKHPKSDFIKIEV
jgi:flavin reductase (DIM6/NTAB) family NADH-FMN oxidoreductase RutF